MLAPTDLLNEACQVLTANDRQSYSLASADQTSTQTLVNSCFFALGVSYRHPKRAIAEMNSLSKGQWQNGMIPSAMFHLDQSYPAANDQWRSWISPFAPDKVATTGITQLPLLAEAIVRVGKALDSSQRLKLYHQFYPVLVSFHQWLYRERDPKQQGLVVQVHPAETALESSPAMMAELDNHPLNWWRKGMHQPSSSSTNNKLNSLVLSSVQQNLRRNGYNNQKILTSKAFAIQDVAFNAVLIRNNQLLKQIASTINQSLPASLLKAIKASQTSFDSLWDPQSNQYCAREFHSNRILTEPSIGGLLALYSSVLSKERSTILVDQLKQSDLFGANFPLSTVPINSSWYQAANINQGAASPVINWLLIDGLLRNGYQQEATVLRHNSLSMISSFGCYEAFNSDSGNGLGAANCASTAAIAIDLMLNPIA